MPTFEIGEQLPNGAILLQVAERRGGEYVVLCWTNGLAAHPFVTWGMDSDKFTYMGHYSLTLRAALDDFDARLRGA